ncbi:hypothetical protein FE374_04060 [Georgenia yuyongxinii]|uniref:Protein kinase domain-containing protein n=1 Tax=Georgenia yuyongxinii TaxID=2589797 RepID=A0A5B8C7L7_9MICO|nr:hypothetical protein [Georgenia yuyongxinii]QDC23916.1 hypothetical protein FE374_04060 [Georgenia yuyongxinii]
MELTSLLDGGRVIEVGATGPEVGRVLSAAGARYLGLVPTRRLVDVRKAAGELGQRFHPLQSGEVVMHSSTDMLVLRAGYSRLLWWLRDLRGVRYVAVEHEPGFGLERRAAEALGRLGGRTRPVGRCTCAGRRFDVIEVLAPQQPRVRHYLSPVWGVAGLGRRLEERGLSHVVLRWFEDLPHLDPGEDLDLLVADADLAAVHDLLAEEPGTIPVDVYSETGRPGADFRGVAYYPPALARLLLDRAERRPGGWCVPAPREHFLSLAHHAVYHKGERSGLTSALFPDRYPDPEHDYESVLEALAQNVGADVALNLEAVDEHLHEHGWRPPPDALRRLSAANEWARRRFRRAEGGPPEPPEPAVFLVRERTVDVLAIAEVIGALAVYGFEPLRVVELDPAARGRCAEQLRGGNWDRGPFPRSGGRPAVAVVALHYAPQPTAPWVRERYPHLSNADVLKAKLRVRDLVAARVPEESGFNPMHSSDNEAEAWEYVEVVLPAEVATLRAEVERRRAEFRTDVPVVRELSRGRRAKVEVVRHDQGVAVRKTFAPSARSHLARELAGLEELAPHTDVPEVLATGANWLLTPFYENRLRLGDRPGGRLVPLRVAREMVAMLRRIHALGIDLVDVKPQNFLRERRGLRLVDLEFLHRYDGAAPPFERMYGFVGVPEGFAGDVPLADELTYEARWLPYTGLTLDQLLHAPRWAQHGYRMVFRARRVLTGSWTPLRRVGGPVRRRLRATLRRSRRALRRRGLIAVAER